MPDLNFQNISTVQNNLQPTPVSIAATTTIVPSTFISLILGATNIKTITPPVSGSHMLALIFNTNASGVFLTTGNITVTTTTVVQNVPVLLIYEPIGAKYYPLLGK